MAGRGWRQFVLRAGDGSELVCWLADDARLEPGRALTLKGDARRWRVVERYATVLPSPPERRWRVGGLS